MAGFEAFREVLDYRGIDSIEVVAYSWKRGNVETWKRG